MTREREEKNPTVLDPERENGAEDEAKGAAAGGMTKRGGELHAIDMTPAQIVPAEGDVQPQHGAGEETREAGAAKKETKEVHQLLINAVNHNANRMNRRLRAQLTGRVQLLVRGSGEAYLLDWRTDDLRTEECRDPEAECTIEIGAGDLFDIARGELNPQIAMLSDKIKVSGEARMAIYFFNLLGVK